MFFPNSVHIVPVASFVIFFTCLRTSVYFTKVNCSYFRLHCLYICFFTFTVYLIVSLHHSVLFSLFFFAVFVPHSVWILLIITVLNLANSPSLVFVSWSNFVFEIFICFRFKDFQCVFIFELAYSIVSILSFLCMHLYCLCDEFSCSHCHHFVVCLVCYIWYCFAVFDVRKVFCSWLLLGWNKSSFGIMVCSMYVMYAFVTLCV